MSQDGRPRVIVLGSAAGGGFPQWNCQCSPCSLAWAGDPRVRPRTQSGLAVTGNGEDWLLVNASPDLGQQIRQTPVLWPRGGTRQSPIRAVVLTNAEVDGCAGLLTLREGQPLQLFATAAVQAALDASPIFDALDRTAVERVTVRAGETFRVLELMCRLVPVPGKIPLYLEGKDPDLGTASGEVSGFTVAAGVRHLAYIPGCARIDDAVGAILATADPILFDGTLFVDDEMSLAGLGPKTGRRMGHLPISGAGGSLAALAAAPATRKVLVHINNTNPILIEDSAERRAVEAAGVEVARDGMELLL